MSGVSSRPAISTACAPSTALATNAAAQQADNARECRAGQFVVIGDEDFQDGVAAFLSCDLVPLNPISW